MTAEDLVSPNGDPDAGRAGHGATPPIVVRAQGATKTLQPGPAYRIGRDPSSDIVVEEPLVSWQHATLKVAEGQWFLEDAGSTNGTFADKTRVRQIPITDSCQIRLGHPEAGPVLFCKVTYAPGPDATAVHSATALWTAAGMRAPTGIMRLPAKVLRIGRSDDNDVVVPDLRVSRHHAELRKSPGGAYEITDLGSHNGTFVNGQRMESSVLTEADVIGVGLATFRLVGDELQQFDDTGDVSLDAQELTVTLSSGKILLNDVSFPLPERCLLGVIGPSGAGQVDPARRADRDAAGHHWHGPLRRP